MIDMGTYWFDDELKPTVTYHEDGTVSYMYCPYIPKFLFDGPVLVSTGEDSGVDHPDKVTMS